MSIHQPHPSPATATYNAASIAPATSTSKTKSQHRHQADRVTQDSDNGPHTLPRRTFNRGSWSFLRTSKSSHSGLWNPVNSSAITGPPKNHLRPGPRLLTHPDQRLTIHTDAFPLKQPPPSLLQSPSSLRVETSHSNSTHPSPKRPGTAPSSISSSRKMPTHLGPPTAPATTPHSSPSDTPSKRPPTPAKDLEYGSSHPTPPNPEPSIPTPSLHSRRASSTKSELPWNPSHPCYPHPNPHIPLSSPLHNATRIIRIPRDWMVAGDLAPTFSNTYPEILEPWVGEASFRTLIKGINERLLVAFSPYGWRAWVDAAVGVATGWMWEDVGGVGVKSGCRGVERWIEEWNGMEGKMGGRVEEGELVRVVPLRRTGYLCLDIQIPDPHVGVVGEGEGEGEGRVDGDGEGLVKEEGEKEGAAEEVK